MEVKKRFQSLKTRGWVRGGCQSLVVKQRKNGFHFLHMTVVFFFVCVFWVQWLASQQGSGYNSLWARGYALTSRMGRPCLVPEDRWDVDSSPW